MNIAEASDIRIGNSSVSAVYFGDTLLWPADDLTVPLTLEAMPLQSGTISFQNASNGNVYYKKNGDSLLTVASGSTGTISVSDGDIVEFYGNNSQYYISSSSFSHITCDCNCYVYGNIMSLISLAGYAKAKTLTSKNAFRSLFTRNENIYSHPEKFIYFPATTLTQMCYLCVFYNCTHLTKGPKKLPATTIPYCAYQSMFEGCGIIEAPDIMATSLSAGCCDSMFKNCTSLITPPPNLRAMTMSGSSYAGMFWGCTSLTKMPQLPATTMSSQCYWRMFRGCSSLTTVTTLPATTLDNRCYSEMFMDCTSLVVAPSISATSLTADAYNCCDQMFKGCTSLTTPPSILAITNLSTASRCYGLMFEGCTSLISAPQLPATTLSSHCYYCMFLGCTSLTTAPQLPATTLTESCYYAMFYNSGITATPQLSATTMQNCCYLSMFKKCANLTTASSLPATTLAQQCYYEMFSECSNLTTAPEIYATSVNQTSCCYYMFAYCSKLNYIKCLATDASTYSNNINYWLNNVASSGTFVKASGTSWPSGSGGIPANWTVQEV